MYAATLHSDALDYEVGYYPPIGLLYIASYLEKHTDFQIKVIDSFTEELSHNHLKERIISYNPDIVGIYTSTFYLFDSILAARNAKAVRNDVIVILGGPHASLYPMECIAIPEVDIVVKGEGEVVMCSITKAIEKNRADPDLEEIPGVLSKKNRNNCPPECKIPVLDELPFPARHLLDHTKYRSILAKRNPITTIISSRGCPYKCKFCSNLESGQRVRFRSPQNVVDELAECVGRYGICDFLFFDELFTINKERVIGICNEITSRGLKIRWHCRSRADVLDEEMIMKMRKSGCRLIQFGIETGSQRLQKLINKNLDLNKVTNTIRTASDHGIYTYGNFMVGLPTETSQETIATIELAKRLDLDYAIFGTFAPLSGSEFYDQGLSEGRFGDFWKEFVINPEVPIQDGSWTRADMNRYYATISDAYKQFYLRPSYMLRRLIRTDSLSQMWWQIQSAFKIFSKLFKKFKK
jgi:anaerobic magnesium-protoporphyrin IX monomethyl ester cyclase